MIGYTITILFIVVMTVAIGFVIGYFVGKGVFYQRGIDDEAARWKSRDEITMKEGVRVEGS